MSDQKHYDGKLEVQKAVHIYRDDKEGQIAIAMSLCTTDEEDEANAAEICRRWNIAPELEQKNRELVEALEEIRLLIGYLTIHGVEPVSPDSDGPQKVPVGKTELKEIIKKIGELAGKAIAERSGK